MVHYLSASDDGIEFTEMGLGLAAALFNGAMGAVVGSANFALSGGGLAGPGLYRPCAAVDDLYVPGR